MRPYSELAIDEKIERLLAAVETTHSGMDPNEFWPATSAQIEAYFDDILAVSIFKKFKKDKGKFKKALARVEPEILKTLLCSGGGIIGLKVARRFENYPLSTEEFKDFVVCILDSIAERRKDDEFCLAGTNLALSQEEVGELARKTTWKKAEGSGIKKAIAGLNVTAESLTWAIFYDIYRNAGMLIHGPYETSKGILLCRDFFDLNPPIWKLKNKYPKLKIYLIYEDGVEISIDFVNHQTYKAPIVNRLKFYSVTADKTFATLREVEKLDDYYSGLRKKQVETVESLKPLDVVKKGTEIHYYMLKDFFTFYGEGWEPPRKVYERIEKFGLKYWKRYGKPRVYGEFWAKKLYDPRNDFVS